MLEGIIAKILQSLKPSKGEVLILCMPPNPFVMPVLPQSGSYFSMSLSYRVGQPGLARMPTELLELILLWTCKLSDKNEVLNQRLVCKAFDSSLRKAAFQTIQVDIPRLSTRGCTSCFERPKLLEEECQAIHVNMSGIAERSKSRDNSLLYTQLTALS